MNAVRRTAALAAAALLALPVAAQAQTRSTTSPLAQQLSIGGLIGFEFAEGETGFGLRADGVLPIQRLQQNMTLEGVGSIGFTRFSEEQSGFGSSVEATTNIVKFVPAARLRLDIAPQLAVYGDAGLGLYYWSGTVETTISGFGTSEVDDSGVGVTMRLAVGGLFALNPQVSLLAEFGANPFFGDVDTTTWNLMVGALFRL
jgi:hypothetical protein